MNIMEFFTDDHRKIDSQLERLRRAQTPGDAKDALEQVESLLHRHIYWEEELLFPEVEGRGLSGPPEVMRMEHGQIWGLLKEIGQAIKRSGSYSAQLDLLEEVLSGHNQKEEGILYPTADSVLKRESVDALLTKLRNQNPPDGWTCRALRRS